MRLMLPYLFEDWVSWGPPTVWSMNPRHSRFHHWREESLLLTLKMGTPEREKQTVKQKGRSSYFSTYSSQKRRNQRLLESWASCWLRSFWKGIQWNKLALCQAHRKCKINVCMNGQMSEYMNHEDALSCGWLIRLLDKKSISSKGSCKIPRGDL